MKLLVSFQSNECLPLAYIIGLIREPKYGHLKELHKVIKLCEKAILNADPTITSLGSYEEVCQLVCVIS